MPVFRNTLSNCGALVLIAALLMVAGCERQASPALLVSTDSVEFGTRVLNETITVAAPETGVNMAIRAEKDCPWLTITPDQVFSTGPGKPAKLTLSVVRALMKPGRDTCRLLLRAQGYADRVVTVRADAYVSADFRVSPATVGEGQPVLFNDATRVITGAEPVTAWKWEFGDGTTSVEQNPVHTYASKGAYTVSLRVESKSGVDVRVRPNCVRVQKPSLPSADFVGATRKPVAGTPVQFRDLSVPGATEITGWLWDFGDGVTSAEQNPIHVFTAASVYDVCLTVSGRNGSNTAVKYGYVDVQEAK